MLRDTTVAKQVLAAREAETAEPIPNMTLVSTTTAETNTGSTAPAVKTVEEILPTKIKSTSASVVDCLSRSSWNTWPLRSISKRSRSSSHSPSCCCGVGLIESLMTLTLIDEITETRGRGNRECIGQGVANIICGFFGGMGGCAMIGQSLINVNSGGRGRLSGIVAAVCLLLFVLFLAPLIEQISMAALVGVMFMVVIGRLNGPLSSPLVACPRPT